MVRLIQYTRSHEGLSWLERDLYLIKIETACVGETKINFWSESFFILFVYFNVFAIRFAWRYFAEACNELQGVFWRHGF